MSNLIWFTFDANLFDKKKTCEMVIGRSKNGINKFHSFKALLQLYLNKYFSVTIYKIQLLLSVFVAPFVGLMLIFGNLKFKYKVLLKFDMPTLL